MRILTCFVRVYEKYLPKLYFLLLVPQGSILGLIQLNKTKLNNFAGNNTITAVSKDENGLLNILKVQPGSTVNRFRQNNMIVSSGNFQVMIIEKSKTTNEVFKSNVDNNTIDTSNAVLLRRTLNNDIVRYSSIVIHHMYAGKVQCS